MDETKFTVWDPDKRGSESLGDSRLRGIYRSPDLIWRESLIPAASRFIGVISRIENLLLPIHVRDAHLCIQDPRLAAFLGQLAGRAPVAFMQRLIELGSERPTPVSPSSGDCDPMMVAIQYFVENQATIHAAFNFHGRRESVPWNEDVTRLEGIVLRLPKLKIHPVATWEQFHDEFDASDTVWYTDTTLLDLIPLRGTILRCDQPDLPEWSRITPQVGVDEALRSVLTRRGLG